MKYLYLLLAILFTHCAYSQYLVMPPKIHIFTKELSVLSIIQTSAPHPYTAPVGEYPELTSYFLDYVAGELESKWVEQEISIQVFDTLKSKEFSEDKLYETLASNLLIYENSKRRPIFGSNYTKEQNTSKVLTSTQQLKEEYQARYIIYTAYIGIAKNPKTISKNIGKDYQFFRGSLHGYSWIVDTETGLIVASVHKPAAKNISLSRNNSSSLSEDYQTSRIDDKDFETMTKVLINKLRRKIKALD